MPGSSRSILVVREQIRLAAVAQNRDQGGAGPRLADRFGFQPSEYTLEALAIIVLALTLVGILPRMVLVITPAIRRSFGDRLPGVPLGAMHVVQAASKQDVRDERRQHQWANNHSHRELRAKQKQPIN